MEKDTPVITETQRDPPPSYAPEESPPTYEEVENQNLINKLLALYVLARAVEQAGIDTERQTTNTQRNNDEDFPKYLLGMVCFLILLLFFIFGLSVAGLFVGSKADCEKDGNKDLKAWLIVYGVVMAEIMAFQIIDQQDDDKERRCLGKIGHYIWTTLSCLGLLFNFIWLIVGSAWVYNYNINDNDCDRWMYHYMWWTITLTWIMSGLIFIAIFAIGYIGMKIEEAGQRLP